MNENTCIFCKIAKKELPSSTVYENDNFIGFLDIRPVAKGHILLITKKHYAWMHEVPDDLLQESFLTVKKLMKAIIKGLACDYVQVSVVGKDVPHFHIHLFPRWFDDGLRQPPTLNYDSAEEQKDIVEKIKNSLT